MIDPKRLAACEIRVSRAGVETSVLVMPPGVPAVAENILRRGRLTVSLSFDEGCDWPDRIGLFLLEGALENGEVAALHFATLADAVRCEARLHEIARKG